MAFDAYFVRHAESAANAGHATDDPATIPLTERGRQQAIELAGRLPIVPSWIAYSTFQRARETAKPLLIRFPSAQSIALPIHEFTYLAPAAWRGTTAAQRRPAVDDYWRRGDHQYCDGDDAESFAGFFTRVETCLDWLRGQSNQPVVLVCHELFIRAVLWRCLFPLLEHSISSMQQFRSWQLEASIPNASVTRISCSESGEIGVEPPVPLLLPIVDGKRLPAIVTASLRAR